jgi:hypothetical protein
MWLCWCLTTVLPLEVSPNLLSFCNLWKLSHNWSYSRTVLCCVQAYHGLRYRFEVLLSELKTAESDVLRSTLLAFVNCLVFGCEDVHQRDRIRNEFLGTLSPVWFSCVCNEWFSCVCNEWFSCVCVCNEWFMSCCSLLSVWGTSGLSSAGFCPEDAPKCWYISTRPHGVTKQEELSLNLVYLDWGFFAVFHASVVPRSNRDHPHTVWSPVDVPHSRNVALHWPEAGNSSQHSAGTSSLLSDSKYKKTQRGNPRLRTETDPVSETLCFLVFRIPVTC